MAGIIRGLITNFTETLRGVATGGSDEDRKIQSEQRHALIEGFLDRHGRLLTMVPMIVILAVSSTNMLAAVWTAFAVSLFLFLLDFYRSRYNHFVPFPNIVQTSLLASYILCVILFYVLVPPLPSSYIGPIVVTAVTGAMATSLVLMYPFTIQYSAPHVDEETRNSLQFYRFNQIITCFWILLMGSATACVWASLTYPDDSAGQIVLGIVMPIVFPVLGSILTPFVVNFLKSRGKANASDKKNDEETTGLLEKA